MEGADGKQESETTSIIKVPKEPAIIINGVPDFPFDCTTGSQSAVKNDAESHVDPRFGEWLEGRKVRKLFGDTYFVGKVAKYDIESNWYTVIYDDGDQEDLEWRELEKVLLPLDIAVPLKTLVIDKCKLKGSVSDSKPKVGRPRKIYATVDDSMEKTSHIVTLSQGNDTNNKMAIVRVDGLQASNQPRKRGRPRKDTSLSADKQPKKRGRPPKNRNAPGNSQGAEDTPGSVALVPVQDDTQESSRKQNSTLIRNAMTARAERLKRENLRVQSRRSRTRLS
ncbi:Dirigent protein 17 [Zea mays]|uniref:Dirigent protein 17 n=1 Tax=Zea mays TaxID=4577 RepID=A0A3L6FBI0_MAIZE|nr:Dirigent protein 17 [Zea mays]